MRSNFKIPLKWAWQVESSCSNPSFSRYIFQLHHDDGGQQRGPHRGGAQLPPQDGRDPRHANLGKIRRKKNFFPFYTILSFQFPNVATNLHIIWYFDALTPSWTKFEFLKYLNILSHKSNVHQLQVKLLDCFILKVVTLRQLSILEYFVLESRLYLMIFSG